MKKNSFIFIILASILFIGCNTHGVKSEESKADDIADIQESNKVINNDEDQGKVSLVEEPIKPLIEDIIKAYADTIENIEVSTPNEASYGLIYVDEDDIPELYYIDNSSHPCGAVIYNYADGKVNRLVCVGSNGAFLYIENKNLLIHKWSGQGIDLFDYYRIKNNTAELLKSYECPLKCMDPNMFPYRINEKDVTKEEYLADYAAFKNKLPDGRFGVSCINMDDSFLIQEYNRQDFTSNFDKYIVHTKADPLSGIDYLTTTFSTIGERKTIELEESFMEQTNTNPEDILLFTCTGDNAGALVFVGNTLDDDIGPAYEGKLWFIDSNFDTEIIFESTNGYSKIDGDLNQEFYYLTEWYTTGGLSYIFDIQNGEPREIKEYSGIGRILENNGFNSYIKLEVSAYDNYCDTNGNYLGHTWKPYYLGINRNIDTCELFEYEGNIISEKELVDTCGFDIISEVKTAGFELGEIYYRDNGIISINVKKIFEDGDTEYNNINYDTNNKCYVKTDEECEETTMENSMFGGIYYSRIMVK